MKKVILFLSLTFCMESVFSFPFFTFSNAGNKENTQVVVSINEKTIENDVMKDYVKSLTSKKLAEADGLNLDVKKAKAGIIQHIICFFIGWS